MTNKQSPTAKSQIQPTIQKNDDTDSDDDNIPLTLPSNSESTKPTQHDHIHNNNKNLIQNEQAANVNNPKIQSINKVTQNNLIKYKISNSSNWENAKILSRAGKATGKFSNGWSIKNNDDNEIELLKHLSNLLLNELTDNETIVHETLISTISTNKAKQVEAKIKRTFSMGTGVSI